MLEAKYYHRYHYSDLFFISLKYYHPIVIGLIAINVQPNPVQFVQMNSEYWAVPIQREADPLHHEGVSNAKYMVKIYIILF